MICFFGGVLGSGRLYGCSRRYYLEGVSWRPSPGDGPFPGPIVWVLWIGPIEGSFGGIPLEDSTRLGPLDGIPWGLPGGGHMEGSPALVSLDGCMWGILCWEFTGWSLLD
jgi:hypothetical protein